MNNPREIEMQIEGVTADVVELIMKHQGKSLLEAFNILYTSKVFMKLSKAEAGLYYQSPVYVYDCLLEELK